jgi:mutator protein MutT
MAKLRYKAIPAVFLILQKANTVLLLRRFQTGYEDGKYTFPAGHVDEGETPTEAIIREAKEEIGIEISSKDLQFVHVQYRKGTDGARTDFYFFAEKWKGEPHNAEPDKCDEVVWLDKEKLPENTLPYVKEITNFIRKNQKYSEFGWE